MDQISTWVVKANHARRLSSFYNRCVRSILGISQLQQWQQRLTSKSLAARFGLYYIFGSYGCGKIAKEAVICRIKEEEAMPWG